jgi:hypothetical protein
MITNGRRHTAEKYPLVRDTKERPILFSAPMVLALLAGTKVQTRRLVTPQPGPPGPSHAYRHETEGWWTFGDNSGRLWRCPYGSAGDRLWVRETWRTEEREGDLVDGIRFAADDAFVPIASTREAAERWVEDHDNGRHRDKWRPSIFLRRWASRITLEITGVRVERLQEISEGDAEAEGVTPFPHDPEGDCWTDGKHRTAFEYLWGEINGWPGQKGARATFESNPWVWVVSFKRVTP